MPAFDVKGVSAHVKYLATASLAYSYPAKPTTLLCIRMGKNK